MRHDVSSFLDDDSITVEVDGRDFTIPSPNARDGLWLSRLANLGMKVAGDAEPTAEDVERLQLDDQAERELYEVVLGSAFEELVEADVPWVKIQRLGRWAFIYFAMGPEQAEQARASGALTGEAPRPNRAQKRAAMSSSSTRGGGKAAARKTPSRGSTGSSTRRAATARAAAS